VLHSPREAYPAHHGEALGTGSVRRLPVDGSAHRNRWRSSVIDPSHPLGSWFLLISSILFAAVIGLPLLIVPLTWARWFTWTVPEKDTHVTIYFGRCLGAVALGVIFVALRAVPDPSGNRIVFDLIGGISALMTGVHIWGAIRRIQPMTETIETAVYLGMTCACFWIRSTLG
jgi:hypothetical protein